MSARLKLKRINDRINGVMKMAQKAQYERDEIHRHAKETARRGTLTPFLQACPHLGAPGAEKPAMRTETEFVSPGFRAFLCLQNFTKKFLDI